jgi:hypothetical protein
MLFHPLRAASLLPGLALLALLNTGLARAETPVFAPLAPPPLLSGTRPDAAPAPRIAPAAEAAAARQPAAPAQAASSGAAAAGLSDSVSAHLPTHLADHAVQPANTSVSREAGVRSTVIEDSGARIEELSVRGSVRSIHVSPKGVGAGLDYEVIPSTGPGGPRDQAPGPATPRGNAGQRVWSLLRF